MPAVRMLGRRWSFATDDVPMLGFVPTMFHGAWAVALLVTWVVIGRPKSCTEGRGYSVIFGGLFSTFVLFFILGCWAMYEGLKGAELDLVLGVKSPQQVSSAGHSTSSLPLHS